MRATVTTAVAIKLQVSGTAGHVITFVIDEFYPHSDNKLMVYVADTMLSFVDQEAHLQEYEGISIYTANAPG